MMRIAEPESIVVSIYLTFDGPHTVADGGRIMEAVMGAISAADPSYFKMTAAGVPPEIAEAWNEGFQQAKAAREKKKPRLRVVPASR